MVYLIVGLAILGLWLLGWWVGIAGMFAALFLVFGPAAHPDWNWHASSSWALCLMLLAVAVAPRVVRIQLAARSEAIRIARGVNFHHP